MVVYDKYYVTISVEVMAFYFLLWKLIPSWDGVWDRFLQPIAEQWTISMIFTIMFATQTFDYIIFKRKSNLYELYNQLKLTFVNATTKWITSKRSRFRTANVFWTLWRQAYHYLFSLLSEMSVLENQREILHTLLCGNEKNYCK